MSDSFPGSRLSFLLLGIFSLCVIALEMARPYLYLAPDSFTYFVMARHAWDAHMLYSYSGIDHTTGIHPGFYFLLIPLYPLFGIALPQWSLAIGMLLVIGGIYALYRSGGIVLAALMLLLALTPYGASVSNNGMESSLLFFALSLLGAFFLAGKRNPFLLGCIMALAVFARLDTVFLAAALYLVLFFNGWTIRELFRASIPLVCMLLFVFFLDYHYGGSLLPLSGKIKSSFPHLSAHWFETLVSLKGFLLSLIVSGSYILWRVWKRKSVGILTPAVFLATAALYLYNGLFVSDIGAWYGTLPFFALAFVLGISGKETIALHWRFRNVGLAIIAGTILWSHAALSGPDWITPHEDAASYLSAHAHAQAGEAAGELKDGVFGFYASLPVYNLTGLANNQSYADALRNGTLDTYLKERNIAYIAGGSFGSGVQVPGARQGFSCMRPFFDEGAAALFHTADCIPPEGMLIR